MRALLKNIHALLVFTSNSFIIFSVCNILYLNIFHIYSNVNSFIELNIKDKYSTLESIDQTQNLLINS